LIDSKVSEKRRKKDKGILKIFFERKNEEPV